MLGKRSVGVILVGPLVLVTLRNLVLQKLVELVHENLVFYDEVLVVQPKVPLLASILFELLPRIQLLKAGSLEVALFLVVLVLNRVTQVTVLVLLQRLLDHFRVEVDRVFQALRLILVALDGVELLYLLDLTLQIPLRLRKLVQGQF